MIDEGADEFDDVSGVMRAAAAAACSLRFWRDSFF